jgi:hypothetical protein
MCSCGVIPILDAEAIELGVRASMLRRLRSGKAMLFDGPVSAVYHFPVSSKVVATFRAEDVTIRFVGFGEIDDGVTVLAL